jgi:hypothetical protein
MPAGGPARSTVADPRLDRAARLLSTILLPLRISFLPPRLHLAGLPAPNRPRLSVWDWAWRQQADRC